ncbi:MAG TPA: glycosyltransferase [Candidatus Kapabacteria bacterium]|nr:glycosyltransferase [Candidatus Kapabacteria bacterium]
MPSTATSYYFERFGFAQYRAPLIAEAPHPQLGMIIVIPCFNEPHLLASLDALWRCERPERAVEVIVVINSSESSPPAILEQNLRSLREAELWAKEDCDRYFRIHFLHTPNLPRKHAGVGLARKIGMDEALHRLDQLNRLDAPIVCFDADSTCDPNYLVEVESYYRANPRSPGCSIYFEHPLDPQSAPSPDNPPSLSSTSAPSTLISPPSSGDSATARDLTDAITLYELHLRYYVEALRFAGFPHAFHTIGSSMAVRANAYMKQGGMNKRQAGEDFYFLHKIIPLGNFGEINTTRIIPSPRPSDRVPFGTGRGVRDYDATRKFETYPLQAFRDLKQLFAMITALRDADTPLAQLAAPLQQFLSEQNVLATLQEIRTHTSSPESFRQRFFRWFDGFLAMKYIHHARDTAYGAADVTEAARTLIKSQHVSTRDLLLQYRDHQRRR